MTPTTQTRGYKGIREVCEHISQQAADRQTGDTVHPKDNDFSPKQRSQLRSRARAVTRVTPTLRFHQRD